MTTQPIRPNEPGSGLMAKPNISGVPELLPSGALQFERMIEQLRTVFRGHGAVPLYTGAFERLSTLRRKAGSTSKEIYTVGRANATKEAEDEGDTLALRFDHTVPLARYVALNHESLAFPFCRYAVGPVWRGERAQRGRYREFVQADLDVIGKDNLPLGCDAEAIVALVASLEAIETPRFTVGVNNRKVLEQLMLVGGVVPDRIVPVLHEFDALPKPHVGVEKAVEAMANAGCPEAFARSLCEFAIESHSDEQTFAFVGKLAEDSDELRAAMDELRRVIELVRVLGVSHDNARVDLSVVRALDYYSGSVFEAKLSDYPAEGAIAAGGRYDNLVADLAGGETRLRHEFQGVGFSVGLTRLFVVLGRLGMLAKGRLVGAQRRILVICRAEEDLERNLSLTAALRKGGIEAMAFQLPKEFHQQLTYAKRNGFTHLLEVLASEEGAHLLELQDVVNPTATRRRVDLKSLLP